MAKPVKVFKSGDLQPGPSPGELIESFGLIRRTSPDGQVHGMNCRLPPATPRKARSHKLFKPVPALQSIERAVEGLHKLIEVLPQTATLREIQSALLALNKIKAGLVVKAMRAEQKAETAPQKPARSALSVSVFKAEALTGRRQR